MTQPVDGTSYIFDGEFLAEARQRLRQLFGSYMVTSFRASAWPGTEVIGSPGLVSVIRFNKSVKEILLLTQPDLQKWLHYTQPSLPEDICLFKEAAVHPSFVSVTHEGQAWLISQQEPGLPGIKESAHRAKSLFFDGPYFCRKYQKRPRR